MSYLTKLTEHIDERLFRTPYSRSLVYNTCWDDPAVDRRALDLTREDVVLVITSAGCNALEFLRGAPEPISKFVLLDHMDWMASHDPEALAEEWRQIFCHPTPAARLIFRSAHRRPRYLETVRIGGVSMMERLAFHEQIAHELSRADRVHTYAGFHICNVTA